MMFEALTALHTATCKYCGGDITMYRGEWNPADWFHAAIGLIIVAAMASPVVLAYLDRRRERKPAAETVPACPPETCLCCMCCLRRSEEWASAFTADDQCCDGCHDEMADLDWPGLRCPSPIAVHTDLPDVAAITGFAATARDLPLHQAATLMPPPLGAQVDRWLRGEGW